MFMVFQNRGHIVIAQKKPAVPLVTPVDGILGTHFMEERVRIDIVFWGKLRLIDPKGLKLSHAYTPIQSMAFELAEVYSFSP
jgi:hypothetical protein